MFRPHHDPARIRASTPDRHISLAVLRTPDVQLIDCLADALASSALMRLSLWPLSQDGTNRPGRHSCNDLALKVLGMKLVMAVAGSQALASAPEWSKADPVRRRAASGVEQALADLFCGAVVFLKVW